MGQITFDELQARFGPTHDVAPWGECIIVQGTEFDSDWEVYLGDAGYCCHFDDLDGVPVVFVPLKVKTKHVSPLAGKSGAGLWTPEEDEFLVALWNRVPQLSFSEMSRLVEEKFPSRKGQAVRKRIERLRALGAIVDRYGNLEVKKVENKVEKKKYSLKGPTWTGEVEAELLKEYDCLVSKGQRIGSYKILAKLPQFKGRSVSGIEQKLKRLLRKRRKGEAVAGSHSQGEKVEQVEEVEQVEQVVDVPETQLSEEKHLVCWTTDEVELFVKLWNENPGYKFLMAHFPNRTEIALRQKATELKKKGVIENSYIVKSKLAKNEPLKEAGEVKVEPVGNPSWKSAAWSRTEDEIIVNCWNKGLHVAEIHVEVVKVSPLRSVKAVASEIARLQRKGVIKPRFKWKGAKAPSDASVSNATPAVLESEKSTKTPARFEPGVSPMTETPFHDEPPIEDPPEEAEPTPEVKPDLEFALVNLALETKRQIDSLQEQLNALKTEFDKEKNFVLDMYVQLSKNTEAIETLEPALRKHKHAVSGEAMPPWEAPQ